VFDVLPGGGLIVTVFALGVSPGLDEADGCEPAFFFLAGIIVRFSYCGHLASSGLVPYYVY
jgi:hypothetical protein